MKVLVVLAVVIVAVSAVSKELRQAMIDQLTKIGKECLEKEKGDPTDLGLLVAHELPKTHEGICMLHCIYQGLSVQNEDGSFNKQGTETSLAVIKDDDPEIYNNMLKLFDICSNKVKVESDPCETSKNFFTCGIEEAKAMGFSFDIMKA